MSVDINLVKELRAITHAPLKDCRAVLEEANGDLDLAQELLRKSGLLKAAKKADRETNQGVVKFIAKDGVVAGVKLLCETDFVAKNDVFHKLVDDLLGKIVAADGEFDADSVDADLKENLTVYVHEHVGTIGENMRLAHLYRSSNKAYVYNHTGNTISSVVFYESDGDVDAEMKEVALQVAAMNPVYVSMDDVPAERKEALRQEFTEKLAGSDKPEDIKQKIVEGQINKFLQDDVLLEQASIRDGAKKIKDVVGGKAEIQSILRITVG